MRLALMILLATQAWGQCTGYDYRAKVEIAGQASTLTGFDVLIADTYDGTSPAGEPDLRVAPTGKVQSSQGFDICFADASDGTSPLPFERASYTGATGAVQFWVRRTLGASLNEFWVFYGKSGASDLSSPTTMWPTSEYQARYSMENSIDSTSNAYNLAATGSPSAASGKIGNAQQINASNYFTWGATADIGTSITLSCWVLVDSGVTQTKLEMFQGGSSFSQWYIELPFGVSSYDLVYASGTYTHSRTQSSGRPTSWTHYVLTRSGTSTTTSSTLYVNGASVSANGPAGTGANHQLTNTDNAFKIPFLFGTGNVYVDECRAEETVRSADYIAARYSNQNNPAGFVTVGAETSTAAATARPRRVIVF